MKLSKISITGLRCYEEISDIPIHSLTVFIGENDSGKSSIVRAIQLLLTNTPVNQDEFHQRIDGTKAEKIEVYGIFTESVENSLNEIGILNGGVIELHVKKVYTLNSVRGSFFLYKQVYADTRLNNYLTASADDLKTLIRDIGEEPARTKPENIELLSRLLQAKEFDKILDWQTVNFSDIEQYLPTFEPILSSDYKDPGQTIQSTIQTSINNRIRSIIDESHPMFSTFKEFEGWLSEQVNCEKESIPEFVTRTLPGFRDIDIKARIDFSRVVSLSSVSVDLGRGLQPLETYGEGTRKKLWMSLMEWNQNSREDEDNLKPVLRVYDEPDLNLDYAAEKRLFDSISDTTSSPDLKIQNILCTHSVTLVDRAPAESINLIRVNEDDSREIHYLRSSDDTDVETNIKDFFSNIGSQLQIRNTELFYEKGFVVFEGETEQELIPALYKVLFGRTLAQDGIVPINMHTCSNWRTTLEFLGGNRSERTVIVLDQDCTFPGSSARINDEVLREMKIQDGVFFVGDKEIEDSFSNDVIVRALNSNFPREDGYEWMNAHIDHVRNSLEENPKFSEDLKVKVKQGCERRLRNEVKKVSIGRAIGEVCRADEIPQSLVEALTALRTRAGI